MINGDTEQFLDTDWITEATLFYNGYIYWHEAQIDVEGALFFVDRWKADNENNLYYHSLQHSDGTLEWERVLEIRGEDFDSLKSQFLESKCYEGKSFWEVEEELAWLDEGSPILV